MEYNFVALKYFDASGKFIKESHFISSKRYVFEIIKDIEQSYELGKLPGLEGADNGVIIFCTIPNPAREGEEVLKIIPSKFKNPMNTKVFTRESADEWAESL